MKRNTAILRGLAAVTALGTMLCTTATTLTFTYSGIINSYLNINTTKIIQPDNANGVVEAAYDNEYGTDSSNNQMAMLLELDVASENITQAEEGTVLLTNHNNVLPLSKDAGVTLFGNGAFHSVGTSSKSPLMQLCLQRSRLRFRKRWEPIRSTQCWASRYMRSLERRAGQPL